MYRDTLRDLKIYGPHNSLGTIKSLADEIQKEVDKLEGFIKEDHRIKKELGDSIKDYKETLSFFNKHKHLLNQT